MLSSTVRKLHHCANKTSLRRCSRQQNQIFNAIRSISTRPAAAAQRASTGLKRGVKDEDSPDHSGAETSATAAARAAHARDNQLFELARDDPDELDKQRDALIASSRAASMQGDHRDAIKDAREAVEIACALVSVDRDTFRISLGQSLLALSNRLLAAGEAEEALPFVRDAVAVSRLIYQYDQSEQALLQLVMALDQLGRAHSALGELDEAISAVTEATTLLDTLSQVAGHLRPDFSTLLQTQSMYCLQAGRSSDAVRAGERAASVARDYVSNVKLKTDPLSFVRLAISLNQLSNAYEADRKLEQTFDATSEAVRVTLRVRDSDWPHQLVERSVFFDGVGTRLWMLYKALPRHSTTPARLRAASDAVGHVTNLWRSTHGRGSDDGIQLRFAESLNNYAEALSERRKPMLAQKALAEATEIYSKLSRSSPMDYLDGYATSLLRQAELASKNKWRGPAVTERCVVVHRQLIHIDQERRVALALALGFNADWLVCHGRTHRQDAIRMNKDAVSTLLIALPSIPMGSGERKAAVEALFHRARFYYKMGMLDECTEAFDKLYDFVEHDKQLKPPGYHQARVLLEQARVQVSKMDIEDAKATAKKALSSFTAVLKESGYGRAIMFGMQAARLRAMAYHVAGETLEAGYLRKTVIRMWLSMMPRRVKPSRTMRGVPSHATMVRHKARADHAKSLGFRRQAKKTSPRQVHDTEEVWSKRPEQRTPREPPIVESTTHRHHPEPQASQSQQQSPIFGKIPPRPSPAQTFRPVVQTLPSLNNLQPPVHPSRAARAETLKARLGLSARARAAFSGGQQSPSAMSLLGAKSPSGLRGAQSARSGGRSLPRFYSTPRGSSR